MNKKIESNKEFISQCIYEKKPIDWICKHINVARDTFRKYFPEYKGNSGFSVERILKSGEIKSEIRQCEKCGKEFIIEGRVDTKTFYKKRYCSLTCSKSRDKYWSENCTHYTTICWKFHKKECIICGEDKIVAVHHFDKDHLNNNPANLVPMCPTHHQYVHSKYSHLVDDKVLAYVNNFTGNGTAWSGHFACTEE